MKVALRDELNFSKVNESNSNNPISVKSEISKIGFVADQLMSVSFSVS